MPPSPQSLDAIFSTIVELSNDDGELQGMQPLVFQILERANSLIASLELPNADKTGWMLEGSDELYLHTCLFELWTQDRLLSYRPDGHWFYLMAKFDD